MLILQINQMEHRRFLRKPPLPRAFGVKILTGLKIRSVHGTDGDYVVFSFEFLVFNKSTHFESYSLIVVKITTAPDLTTFSEPRD